MFDMCQCLFIISFIFGSTELYVTENGVESLCLDLQFFTFTFGFTIFKNSSGPSLDP